MKIKNLLESHEFDILYHGSNANFTKLDANFSRTAKHIYTTPDPNTASAYGKHIYEIKPLRLNLADLINDNDLKHEVAKEISHHFNQDNKFSIKNPVDILKDDQFKNIPSIINMVEDANEKTQQILLKIQKDNPDMDDDDLKYELQFDDDYEQLIDSIRSHVSYLQALNIIDSSVVYEYDNSGRLQDEIMDICYSMGYNAVMFYDRSMTGDPISIVFEDGNDLEIIGMYTE